MKNVTTSTIAAAITGHILLYCYRSYLFIRQQVGMQETAFVAPAGPHVLLTPKKFTVPCYN